MKNTRKKMLLSSIAMLLVALVALGSATYAWFTTNPNATAEGLKMKASSSKGLVIQTSTHGAADATFWGHTDYLNYDSTTHVSSTTSKELSPASYDWTVGSALGTGHKVEANSDDNYAAKAGAAINPVTNTDVYSETIACKLTGAASASDTAPIYVTGLTITADETKNQYTGIRVAVEYNNKLMGVYSPGATRTNKAIVGDASGNFAAATSLTSDKTTAVPSACVGLPYTGATVGTTGADNFKITVYIDGEDSNTTSLKIQAADLLTKIELNLSLTNPNP